MIIDKETIVSSFDYKGTLLGAIKNLTEVINNQNLFVVNEKDPILYKVHDYPLGTYYFCTENGVLYQYRKQGAGVMNNWSFVYEFINPEVLNARLSNLNF